MSIKTDIRTPIQTLNYMKYVEIENDTRYPAVTGGAGQGVFNKSAILVQQVDPFNTGIGSGTGNQGFIEKFGSNLDVGANLETIWNNGGLYTYLSSASSLYVAPVVGDQGDDEAGGIGARTVTIQGLDASYHEVEETVTVVGAPTTTKFLRVNRAFVATVGSKGTNTKPVLISTAANGTGTILANISTHGTGVNEEGFGQTFLGLYTVPAGKTGYLTQWTVGSSGTTSVQSYFRYKPFTDGNIFKTLDNIYFVNGHQVKDYKVPLQLEEKSDVEVQAYNNATGVAVSTSFNIILVDNE